MAWLVAFITLLSAVSAWQRPWVPLPAGWMPRELNAALGALVGLGLSLPLWWWLRRPGADGEALRRWWQRILLALAGGASGGLLFFGLEVALGSYDALGQLGGVAIALGVLGGFALGARGPIEWRKLWAGDERARPGGSPKLLDTSVLIDGRIGELVETGFVEGTLVLPHFVLRELHTIADSSEPLRRRKGRRGLDILGELRRSPQVQLETSDHDFPDHPDVDRKLIELAKSLRGDLVTTDFNLNKVAKVEGIKVLNINELANAVKPRYLPGEDLEVEIIDRGEEIGQGIGYLDDGTMVVVENGRRFIGQSVSVVVNSMLQTDAGKMLFVRLKGEERNR